MSSAGRVHDPARLSTSDSPRSSDSFPGLLAALRPIRRISTQLADEAVLLRRFTYKNKNQHKGCGWWRKIVEVDRLTSRTKDELEGLLLQFGAEESVKGKGKEEGSRATSESVAQGLLRLPRSCLLVERYLEVILNTANTLEQLILSRAFLPFALVVVAVIARLHSLSTVLLDELVDASAVIARLTASGPLLSAVRQQIRHLPRELRRFCDPSLLFSAPAIMPIAPRSPPALADDNDNDEEMGLAVVRDVPAGKLSPRPLERRPQSPRRFEGAFDRRNAQQQPTRVVQPEPESILSFVATPFLAAISSKSTSSAKKREKLEKKEGGEKVKKKRRTKGDEIDDIFG